jgi:hypothetical protein
MVEGMISAVPSYGYDALMALVTRFHANALVERKHALEGYDMKTTTSRDHSTISAATTKEQNE